jgi:DNA mismatch endonuclease, patch repair protein
MTDKLSPERRSQNMAAIRAKDTKPELIVRRLVHALGFRYRLHRKDLPGKPDLVFGTRHKVIFVHGCFWHGCKRAGCLDARRPKSNTEYWNPKIEGNKARDLKHQEALQAGGWQILIVWDCETKDMVALQERITNFLADDTA